MILNGLFNGDPSRIGKMKVLFLPAGSGNDLHHSIDGIHVDDLEQKIETPSFYPIDIGTQTIRLKKFHKFD